MEKNIRLKIESKQYDCDNFDPIAGKQDDTFEEMEMFSEGVYSERDSRIEIRYCESEAAGLAGCTTTVSFESSDPGVVSTLRSGNVLTALVFEKGRRHICSYEIPEGRFDVCVNTFALENSIDGGRGRLFIDYTIEIGGIKKLRTKLTLTIL